MHPVDIVANESFVPFDDPRLNDPRREEDEGSLQQERIDQSGAAQGSQEAAQAREKECAEDKAENRGKRFDPAIRFEGSLVVRAAEPNEYSVPWSQGRAMRRGKDSEKFEHHYLPVCMDTKVPYAIIERDSVWKMQ